MFLDHFFENSSTTPVSHEKKNDPPFERCERTLIEVAGGTAEVYDYTPDPEHLKDNIPIILAPGCGGNDALYHKALSELVNAYGRRVITLDHPKQHPHPHAPWEEATSKELERKAHNLFDVIAAKGLEKVDAIAHSEGAINIITAAAHAPERFRNIILVAPAGLMKGDSFGNLALRFARNFFADRPKTLSNIALSKQEESLTHLSSKFKRVLHCVYGNLLHVLSEIKEIVKSDIYSKLGKLKESNIKIVIVAPVEDDVFPIKRIQEMLDAGSIDGFLSVRGGHGDITRILPLMDAVGSLFETMEKGGKKN